MTRSTGPAFWILSLARALAPGATKPWLEDMRHELVHVEGSAARARWALDGLGVALRDRLGRLRWEGSPGQFVAATVVVALLVAVPVVVPRLNPGPGRTTSAPVPAPAGPPAENDGMAGGATGNDALQAPTATADGVLNEGTLEDRAFNDDLRESFEFGNDPAQDRVDSPFGQAVTNEPPGIVPADRDVEQVEEAEQQAASSRSLDEEGDATATELPTTPFDPVPAIVGITDANGARAEAEAGTALGSEADRARAQQAAPSLTVPGVVRLTVAEPVLIEVYRGQAPDAERLQFSGEVAPGEVMELEPPVFVRTDDPGKVAVAADDLLLGVLSDYARVGSGYLMVPTPPDGGEEPTP